MVKEKPNSVRIYDKEGFRRRAACICVRSDAEAEVRFFFYIWLFLWILQLIIITIINKMTIIQKQNLITALILKLIKYILKVFNCLLTKHTSLFSQTRLNMFHFIILLWNS